MLVNSSATPSILNKQNLNELNVINIIHNPYALGNRQYWRNKHLKSHRDEQRTKWMINDFLRKLRTILWTFGKLVERIIGNWCYEKMGRMRKKIDIELGVRIVSTWVVQFPVSQSRSSQTTRASNCSFPFFMGKSQPTRFKWICKCQNIFPIRQ